jgi:hypothetical protein
MTASWRAGGRNPVRDSRRRLDGHHQRARRIFCPYRKVTCQPERQQSNPQSRRDRQSTAARITLILDTTRATTQPATLLSARMAPTAVPIPITPAVATIRTAADSRPALGGFPGRNPDSVAISQSFPPVLRPKLNVAASLVRGPDQADTVALVDGHQTIPPFQSTAIDKLWDSASQSWGPTGCGMTPPRRRKAKGQCRRR